MATTTRRHLIPVRLIDIPVHERLTAARRAAKTCNSEGERAELLAVALSPSSKIYWVHADAERLAA